MDIDYPYHFDGRGRTATTDLNDHIRDMIEELLLTSPGERVNRPDFGSGLLQMVFAPAGTEVATALKFTIQAAVQRWLGLGHRDDAPRIERPAGRGRYDHGPCGWVRSRRRSAPPES